MRIVRERKPPTMSIAVEVVFPVLSEVKGTEREKILLRWVESAVRNHHTLCAGNIGFNCEVLATEPTVVKLIAK